GMVERYLTSQRDAGFKVSTIWGSGPEAYTFTSDMIAENFSTKWTTAVERRNFRNDIKKAIHDILCVA
ncbi:hypothetical protein QP972_11205, partial [Corynebacterium sp. MSK078]|nr:hypothetical protein [Corynebacterium sp. MSK078]